MSNKKTFETTQEVIEILVNSTIESNIFKLPDIKLERSQYEAVNEVLAALGAKWNRKVKGHVFDYDIKDELARVIQTGIVTDWKKSTDYFYTPKVAQEFLFQFFDVLNSPETKVLEPSAGQGHLLDALKEKYPQIELIAVENNPYHVQRLQEKGYKVIADDFLNVQPQNVRGVFMNPPFTYEIEHIKHAYDFMTVYNSILVSVASASIKFNNDKKHKAFREWIESVNGNIYDMPDGSFKESGTSVNTVAIVINRKEI